MAYDQVIPAPFTAPSGNWQQSSGLVASATTTVISGNLALIPFDVGPSTKPFNALAVRVGVAQVAGTTTTTLGTYPDNGTGGLPNLVGGPKVSGAVVLTATGNISTAVTWSPTPGRYWLAWLYYASAAPTTVAQVSMVTSSVNLWLPFANNIGSAANCLFLAGQTALPTTQVALAPTGFAYAAAIGAKAV